MFLFLIHLLLFFLAGCGSLHVPAKEHVEIPPFSPKKPIRIALVLGGGGARGLAHLGALEELNAAGIRPDLIVGCSAGAVIGAFYADNPELIGIAPLFLPLKRKDLLDLSFFNARFGFAKGSSLNTFLHKHIHAKTFAELKIPFIAIATDLLSGETIELSEGSLSKAISASCAFPGIFKPVFLHNRHLIDGGVSDPVPVEIAKKYGAEVVIAIDVSEKLSSSKPNHLLGIAKRSLEIAYLKRIDLALTKAHCAIKMEFQDAGMLNDRLNAHIYETGRMKMRERIAEIKSLLEASNTHSEK